MLEGPGHLLGVVDLARLETVQKVFDGEVHRHDLVRLLEEGVGHRLAHHYAGRPLDQAVQGLEVLHIEGADDVDPRVDELDHVLVPAPVARARRIGVRDLVDNRHLRAAREDGVEVHFLERHAAVLELLSGNGLQALDQRLGLGATVRLREPDDDVDAALLEVVCLLEHAVGLADARCEPQVDLEPPTLRALDQLEEILRTAAFTRVHFRSGHGQASWTRLRGGAPPSRSGAREGSR